MKTIEVDEDLYRYIASQTRHIGESASDILRRLLTLTPQTTQRLATECPAVSEARNEMAQPVMADCEPDTLTQLLSRSGFADKESAIDRFMLILWALYQLEPAAFTRATEIKGRKRVYFARSEEELQANGKTTKPRAVQDSPYWVISNTNTGRKRYIVAQLMAAMGYPQEPIDRLCDQI